MRSSSTSSEKGGGVRAWPWTPRPAKQDGGDRDRLLSSTPKATCLLFDVVGHPFLRVHDRHVPRRPAVEGSPEAEAVRQTVPPRQVERGEPHGEGDELAEDETESAPLEVLPTIAVVEVLIEKNECVADLRQEEERGGDGEKRHLAVAQKLDGDQNVCRRNDKRRQSKRATLVALFR